MFLTKAVKHAFYVCILVSGAVAVQGIEQKVNVDGNIEQGPITAGEHNIETVEMELLEQSGGEPCEDSLDKFVVDGLQGEKDCASLEASTRRALRCNRFPEFKQFCPKTCGLCGDSTASFDHKKTTKSAKSDSPSVVPSNFPSVSPSLPPSVTPTVSPSRIPSSQPSDLPSDVPSDAPSSQPSSLPSSMPSDIPSDIPSVGPSDVPSDQPSSLPSSQPSGTPSDSPSNHPSSSPSDVPSRLPSSSPSDFPSSSPSGSPSNLPSSSPSVCYDLSSATSTELATTVWRMPNDGIWKNTNYVGKSCQDLESEFSEDSERWCTLLSNGIFSDHSPKTACCFCGGGQFAESSCKDLSFSDVEENGIQCSDVEKLPNVSEFCVNHGDDTFSADGRTMKEACCVCGGGENVMSFVGPKLDERRLRMDSSWSDSIIRNSIADAELDVEEGDTKNINHNIFFHDQAEQLGDFSPGVSNMEYLGIGYNIFEGWPRGSETTKIDPGFRYRVLKILQVQENITSDAEFTVPLGTELKYTSTCVYDDKSIEISTESDLKSSLSREFSTEEASASEKSVTEKNRGSEDPETTKKYVAIGAAVGLWTGGPAGAALGAAVGFGVDWITNSNSRTETKLEKSAFKKNEQYQESLEQSLKTNSHSFESRAFCSEFEVSFNPFAKKYFDNNFQRAIQELPVPFDSRDKVHVAKYTKFIEVYGTHVLTKVVLGGKRIVRTEMSSTDFSQLVSEDVEVAETLSFEVASGLAKSEVANLAAVKGALSSIANMVGGATGPKGAAVASVVDVVVEAVPDEAGSTESTETETNFSEKFSKNKKQAENAEKIRSKQLFTSEITIGGSPDADWRSWSQTIRDKPMPVSYSLTSLVDFMRYEQALAFDEAVNFIYAEYIVSEDATASDYPLNMHVGVYLADGTPISDIPYDQTAILKSRVTKKQYSSFPRDQQVSSLSGPIELLNFGLAWRGKPDLPLPMFATKIHGDVSSNADEEKGGYFLRKTSVYDAEDKNGVRERKTIAVIDYQNSFPFAACQDQSSQCLLSFTNFDQEGKSRYKSTDSSFSFIQVDHRIEDDFTIAGVVNAGGVSLNDNKSFSVKKVHDDSFGSRFAFEIKNFNFGPCEIQRLQNVERLLQMYVYLSNNQLATCERKPLERCCLDFGIGCWDNALEASNKVLDFFKEKRILFEKDIKEKCIQNTSGSMRYNTKDDVPIVVLFPRVENDNYPDTIRDVSLFLLPKTTKSTSSFHFEAKASFEQTGSDYAPVGVNFLALSPVQRKANTKFGYIHGLPGAKVGDHRLYGLQSVSVEFESRNTEFRNAYRNVYKIDIEDDDDLFEKCEIDNVLGNNNRKVRVGKEYNAKIEAACKCKESGFIYGDECYWECDSKCNCMDSSAYTDFEEEVNCYHQCQFFQAKLMLQYIVATAKDKEDCLKSYEELDPIKDKNENAELAYSFPSPYFQFNARYRSERAGIREGKNRYGGVRVVFDEPFETLPSVIVTPVMSDDSKCKAYDKAQSNQASFEDEYDKEQFRMTNVHAILQCMVETITKEDCFVKCACIYEEFVELKEDGSDHTNRYFADKVEITPLPFNLVAVGPSKTQSSTMENIAAKYGTATQSSTAGNNIARFAIDGEFDLWTETDSSPSQFWEVDMHSLYDIEEIIIYYRKDMPLPGYKVSIISNYGNVVATKRRADANSNIDLVTDLLSNEAIRFQSSPTGSKVRIELDGSIEGPISLVEVEVLGRDFKSFRYDVAVGKQVHFEPNAPGVDASSVTSGDLSDSFTQNVGGTVVIDLNNDYSIHEIVVHIGDMSSFNVIIEDRKENQIFVKSYNRADSNDSRVTFPIHGEIGMFVKIVANSFDLFGVEVIGNIVPQQLNKEGEQCSFAPDDGCSNGLSCGRTSRDGDYRCCSKSYMCSDEYNASCIFGQEYCYGSGDVGDTCYDFNADYCKGNLVCGDYGSGNVCCQSIDEDRNCLDPVRGDFGDYCGPVFGKECKESLQCGRTSYFDMEYCCTRTERCPLPAIQKLKFEAGTLNVPYPCTYDELYCINDKSLGDACVNDNECGGDLKCARTTKLGGEKCCEPEGVEECKNSSLGDGFGDLENNCVDEKTYCKIGYSGSKTPSTTPSNLPSDVPSLPPN